MPALLLLSGPSAGLRFDVKSEAVLGRSPSCDIPLEDHKVSRRHAKILVQDGEVRISDLGSRNGTVVNGEKIDAEAILLPGDRVQVGDTTALFEPPSKASFAVKETGELRSVLVEELLPRVGPEAALYSAGIALLGATSEAMVLRRAAEEGARSLSADRAAALLGGTEGLMTAAVVGADAVQVPKSMVQVAMERKETSLAGGILCAPLAASGGSPFGILYAERSEPFTEGEERLASALGRLVGEAFAAVRSRDDRAAPEILLVGSSRQFRRTVEQARRAAAGGEPVLLHGEAGTGKTLAAHYIHGRSTRALGPLVEVDCRTGSPRIDEELFGRASGPGVPPLASALLRADGGTLVLRHVHALARPVADRLAKYLQRRAAPAPAGGEEPVDVRVIATTSAPLQHLVARGELDPELGRALAGTEIEALPLRERRTDVPALFETFAQRVTRPLRKELPILSPDAKRMLVDYGWPGNVRELRLVAERIAELYPGQEVSALRVPPEVQEGAESAKPRTLQDMISRLERDAIAEALRVARGKKIRAAAILGISRPTLDKKIEDYNLIVEKVRGS
jgi:DNA-binding NtrC family response regulator/pSer/pThr/pTyr-binding forkhead associated (FHA) protein